MEVYQIFLRSTMNEQTFFSLEEILKHYSPSDIAGGIRVLSWEGGVLLGVIKKYKLFRLYKEEGIKGILFKVFNPQKKIFSDLGKIISEEKQENIGNEIDIIAGGEDEKIGVINSSQLYSTMLGEEA